MKPLHQAEQAVLGAALLEPKRVAGLTGWLEPDHFHHPMHRALYAALLKLHQDGHPGMTTAADTATSLSWVNDAVAEAGQHVRGLTSAYAHSLVRACPRPRHAHFYGRMVLEGAIHRRVTEHAIRLHQAARTDAAGGEVEDTLHYAQVLTESLTDLRSRWGTEPRSAPHGSTPSPADTDHRPPEEKAVAEERLLLSALIARPDGLDEVAPWLRPADFALPSHGRLYLCLTALHHRGDPIDSLTLLWETQRLGLLADGTVTSDEVRDLDTGISSGSAEYLAEQVLRASLLRVAATSARTVRDVAEDDALTPGRLIGRALHALRPLDEVSTRWRRATSDAPSENHPAQPPSRAPSARAQAARARSSRPLAASRPAPAPPSSATALPGLRTIHRNHA